jgi:hypothetical protein
MRKQAAAAQAAAGFFKWPGKSEREGQNFETEFRLQYNQSANLIIVSDPILVSGHSVPVRWQDKYGKPEYKIMRCTRFELRPTSSGFEATETKRSHKCLYCEDATFGGDMRGYYVMMAYTDNTYSRKNGTTIGPRLVFIMLTDRDQGILSTLANDMAKYGSRRKSAKYPNGTLVGMKYRIGRGSDQRSRSIGDSMLLVRDSSDRPAEIEPEKLMGVISSAVSNGKYAAINLAKAFPFATVDEQKLVLKNATSLNDQYNFVRGAVADHGAHEGIKAGGTASGSDIDVEDMLGVGSGADESSNLSNLSKTLKAKRQAKEDDAPDGGDADLLAEGLSGSTTKEEEEAEEEKTEKDEEVDVDDFGEEEEDEDEEEEEEEKDGNDTSDEAEEAAPHMKNNKAAFSYVEDNAEEAPKKKKDAKKDVKKGKKAAK